ncbi:MAG TPA: glutamate-5-semialdehyde dehydrogenase [Actinophytocola sp.]|uniref:glutamate-5-semialdehyde dehydrogenase n=1 Tax=Actinophytocola sp. TaxID=1872138 RepID=UPI002DB5D5E8|nr:glutamate-5-semialdehyde dehydrogenase [Actinophytocola sp.]HEU5471322.1 glutamate-5-semialdehyde dehydrogenase [Actinophytocola sp.]
MTEEILDRAARARDAAPPPGDERYLAYCDALATRLDKRWDRVRAANDVDLARAGGLPDALADRLRVGDAHREQLVALAGEVGRALPAATRPSEPLAATGRMRVRRIPKPLGVLLMIYEARPTVTVEGALLPVAVGNVAILRGGTEMAATNAALGAVVAEAAEAAGLPDGMVQVLTDGDRALVRQLLRRHDAIDALVPRGSPALIEHCRTASTIPVIASGGGVNHLYVDASADLDLAARIALDSKLAEPTACNTLELVLAHADVAEPLARRLVAAGIGLARPYTLRLDAGLAGLVPGGPGAEVRVLGPHDDGREFLDRTLGLRAVAGLDEAVGHIRRHGSRHTEGVVATRPEVIDGFLRAVDAAALVVNGSLRLHDGPTMRLGPEISISTGRLHVRGPVGLTALLTYSWAIEGNATLRGEGAR